MGKCVTKQNPIIFIIILEQRFILCGCHGVIHTCCQPQYGGLHPKVLLHYLIDSWQSGSGTKVIATDSKHGACPFALINNNINVKTEWYKQMSNYL
jgi:hypothetical protein